ncbi:MAG: NmrA/HSCARG family protein [Acidipropionibacterium acidipropionici]|uniref:NmrA family protein n=1 Tax=Acidipropionibacterium acidipropionici (strain ATCC 4875 / DSM 20272 / JCM 6432 / NBRC 12425 / NCIMB 8070 / 4) TaxID=1171373 RepID=K7RUM9_ACIA4|nr:NmrA/HSCARG family protein [Acidipropionibacterium acidipropionici]AFV90121.1 NmrA family protein [Acidipropionibacterium acidipropionici ATCC 4875]
MSTNNQNSSSDVVGVVGATGHQGGATVTALLEAGAHVRALVRDVTSQSAQNLAARGTELVIADLDRPDGLVPALAGVDVLFVMATFTGPNGTAGETSQGRAIGDAAQAAGVSRIVYSSVGGAERHTGIPHFESKRRIEEYLETLAPSTTFIRPTFFMDNFLHNSEPTVEDGTVVVRLPLPAGIPLQMVSVRDVGRAAAHALLTPSDVPGDTVELVGDELTGEQIAAAFGDVEGLPARYEPIPVEALADKPDQQAMFSWFAQLPAYRGDAQTSRALVPDLLDLRGWLALQ